MSSISPGDCLGLQDSASSLSIRSLNCVDMSTLSQSELRAICSSRSEPLPIAASSAIDRFSFNESYGSRRQTYSRLSPSHHHHRHHRLAAPLPKTHSNQPSTPNPGPDCIASNSDLKLDRLDCRSILDSLKFLLTNNPDFQFSEPSDLNSVDEIYNNETHQGPTHAEDESKTKTRKRGRKPRAAGTDWGSNIVSLLNKNKTVVDLDALEGTNDPFSEELVRRTSNMDGENELLSFFAALNGEWCSRRKRRKVVNADEFGDALPMGWKLLLGIKRKDGRSWVYCRRYVSPDGHHFATCKDAAKYLRILSESRDGNQEKDYIGENLWHVEVESSEMVESLDGEFVLDIEVGDLFECFRCNISFQEKDSYLTHLSSAHQKHTKKKFANSVGEGVIIKDGKFECQFCHKVFEEKRRYFSHVGIHVRNYVRGIEDVPGIQMALEDTPVTVDFPATTSRMDALIQIAQMPQKWNTNSKSEWNHENEMSDSTSDSELEHKEADAGEKMLNLNDVCDVVDVMVQNDHNLGIPEMGFDNNSVRQSNDDKQEDCQMFPSFSDRIKESKREELQSFCVWCGVEFVHVAVDSELQSDSVGFMCPTCKAKTCG